MTTPTNIADEYIRSCRMWGEAFERALAGDVVQQVLAHIQRLALDAPDGAHVIRQALVGAQWEWLVQHHRDLTGLEDYERLYRALGPLPRPTRLPSDDTTPPGSPA